MEAPKRKQRRRWNAKKLKRIRGRKQKQSGPIAEAPDCSSARPRITWHHEKLTKRKEITIEVQVPLVCQLPVDAGEPFPVACNTAPTHGNTIAIFKASAPTSGPLVLWSTLLALGGEDSEVEHPQIGPN